MKPIEIQDETLTVKCHCFCDKITGGEKEISNETV